MTSKFFSGSRHGFLAGKSYTTQLPKVLDDVTHVLYQVTDLDIIHLGDSAVLVTFKGTTNKSLLISLIWVPHK